MGRAFTSKLADRGRGKQDRASRIRWRRAICCRTIFDSRSRTLTGERHETIGIQELPHSGDETFRIKKQAQAAPLGLGAAIVVVVGFVVFMLGV